MNNNPQRPNQSQTPVKSPLPSYKTGWGFLIAAVVEKIVGSILTGAMANSGRGQAMGDYLYRMNQVAMVNGVVDLLMVVLGIIGIVLLVRTYLARSRAARQVP